MELFTRQKLQSVILAIGNDMSADLDAHRISGFVSDF